MSVAKLAEPLKVALFDERHMAVHYDGGFVATTLCGKDFTGRSLVEVDPSWGERHDAEPVCHACRGLVRVLLRGFYPRADLPGWVKD